MVARQQLLGYLLASPLLKQAANPSQVTTASIGYRQGAVRLGSSHNHLFLHLDPLANRSGKHLSSSRSRASLGLMEVGLMEVGLTVGLTLELRPSLANKVFA